MFAIADNVLIYGANGYTGELVARSALERGLRPILAGRSAEGVAAVAHRLDLPHVVVSLDDGVGLDRTLTGRTVVIHCAGPFRYTSRPLAAACLRGGVHYLDITGEIAVFEDLARHNAEARAAGIMLLPGAGFDVVPSDCLAAHLKRRLPTATSLELAFRGLGRISRGTATTALESLGSGGAVRRDGTIMRTPIGKPTRRVDFGRGPVPTVAIPWGDISTAYHSTRIPNITVYTYLPPLAVAMAHLSETLSPLMSTRPVADILRGLARRQQPGPDDAERAHGLGLLWGEARDDEGRRVATRMRTPEAYRLTAMTAVLIAQKVLAGDWSAGFQTPSSAYGPDLIMEIAGVERVDL